jgi:hypothetical protein
VYSFDVDHVVFYMALSQVADGVEGLQMWRVAANVLNKQSRIYGRG